MRRIFGAVMVLAISMATPAVSATPPYADDQLWSEIDISARAGPANLTALAVVRDGAGQPNPTLAGGGLIADLPVGRGFTLSGGDLWVRVRTASGAGVDVQVPLAAVSYAWRWDGFALSDRNRAERLIGARGDPWRYRNRLAVTHALAAGPIRSLFASDEVFYDFGADRWSRNRAQVGVGLKPLGPAGLALFYMRQDDRTARPGGLNILGFDLQVSL